jgi:hypothetical protein
MTPTPFDQEIDSLEASMKPIQERLTTLYRERNDWLSRSFIETNGIKWADVEMSDGPGKPWFGNITSFISWMKAQPTTKNWAEWNTVIYRTSDLLNGRMPDMPGRIDDLPKG